MQTMAETKQDVEKSEHDVSPRQSGTVTTTETATKSTQPQQIALGEVDVSSGTTDPCVSSAEREVSSVEAAGAAEGTAAAKPTQTTIRDREKALPQESTHEEGNDQITTDDPPKQPLQADDKLDVSGSLERPDKSSKGIDGELSKTNQAVVAKHSVSSTNEDSDSASPVKSVTKDDQAQILSNQMPDQSSQETSQSIEAPVGENINNRQKSTTLETEPDNFTDHNEISTADQEIPTSSDARLGENIASFVRPSDQTIDEARQRLKTALEQTYALRKAFTERVYGKYRVCLHPPNTPSEAEARINKDPAAAYEQLCREISKYQEEKEIEKKFANKINSDVSAIQQAQQDSSNSSGASPAIAAVARMFAQGNVDHGDQLLYVSAGLNLIILPEEDVPETSVETYSDRCPIHPVTGQRVKNISLAAATAGDVMLERKRKAMLLRMERQQQNPSQYPALSPLTMQIPTYSDNAKQANSVVADSTAAKTPIFPPTTVLNSSNTIQSLKVKTSEAPALSTAACSKSSRSRGSSGLSFGQLLSLNPTAEEYVRPPQEIKNFAPSTLALMARGSRFGGNKSAQQRLRHPHPDSLGGRRRAGVDAPHGSVDPIQSEPFPNEYLALTLPPLPGTKERQERKPLSVCSTSEASTQRGISSIQKILDNFVVGGDGEQTCDVTKIKLLYGLPRLASKQKSESVASVNTTSASMAADGKNGQAPSSDTRPLDPILTFSVLHAVGLLGRAPATTPSKVGSLLPAIDENNSAAWSSKLKSFHESILNADKSLTSAIFAAERKRRHEETEADAPEKKPKLDHNNNVDKAPLESIRGGGGASKDKNSENMKDSSRKSQLKVKGSRKMSEDSATSIKSAPVMSSSVQMSNLATPAQSVHMYNMQMMNQMGNYTQFQMVNAMHQLHHPAAGDLANLRNFQQQHAVAQLMGTGSNPMHSLSPFGGIGGIVSGYGPMAAHGLLTKEQTDMMAANGIRPFPHIKAPFANGRGQAPSISANQHSRASKGKSSLTRPGSSGPTDKKIAADDGRSNKDSTKAFKKVKEDTGKPAVESKIVLIKDGDENGSATKQTTTTTTGTSKEDTKAVGKESKSTESKDDKVATNGDTSINDEKRALREIAKSEPESTEGKNPFAEQWKSKDKHAGKSDEHGMKYYTPRIPDSIDVQEATLIRTGYVHSVLEKIKDMNRLNACLEYLHQAGAAVPIPKSLVLSPLRERLTNLALKIPGNGASPPLPRDAVTAVILVWLWANHESNFQNAFEKSGRIDVDPDCKWLIQTAVDTAARELSVDITDSLAKGEGVYADALTSKKNLAPKSLQGQGTADSERNRALASKKIEIRTVIVVSKALMVKLHIEPFANKCIPNFEPAIAFLDESRLGALRAKSQERVMLANLLARKTTISESFSHAYVSAMVRAGEALGHGKLFEIVQSEELHVSTMIPYDIFTDETGAWEDPCKTDTGFSAGLTGEELIRRAHARAMFHKSLRKLQDRHNIRGGVRDHGPYADVTEALRVPSGTSIGQNNNSSNARVGLKRRHSFSEPPPPPGTGSAQAASWAIYQPQHVSEPLEWHPHHLENKPYGRYRRGGDDRGRSLSFSGARGGLSKKAKKSDDNNDIPPTAALSKVEAEESDGKIPKSTCEINWGDLAGIFQRVELPRARRSSSSRNLKKNPTPEEEKSSRSRNIFAPFCRQITNFSDLEREIVDASSDEEEEDISDETLLANHQLVLDEMKAKIQAYMDAKKNQREQKKMKMSK